MELERGKCPSLKKGSKAFIDVGAMQRKESSPAEEGTWGGERR